MALLYRNYILNASGGVLGTLPLNRADPEHPGMNKILIIGLHTNPLQTWQTFESMVNHQLL